LEGDQFFPPRVVVLRHIANSLSVCTTRHLHSTFVHSCLSKVRGDDRIGTLLHYLSEARYPISNHTCPPIHYSSAVTLCIPVLPQTQGTGPSVSFFPVYTACLPASLRELFVAAVRREPAESHQAFWSTPHGSVVFPGPGFCFRISSAGDPPPFLRRGRILQSTFVRIIFDSRLGLKRILVVVLKHAESRCSAVSSLGPTRARVCARCPRRRSVPIAPRPWATSTQRLRASKSSIKGKGSSGRSLRRRGSYGMQVR
jgi:hypothetical protein